MVLLFSSKFQLSRVIIVFRFLLYFPVVMTFQVYGQWHMMTRGPQHMFGTYIGRATGFTTFSARQSMAVYILALAFRIMTSRSCCRCCCMIIGYSMGRWRRASSLGICRVVFRSIWYCIGRKKIGS